MKKVIIFIHGLRNKPPKDTLKEWIKLSINEGIENSGLDIDLPNIKISYWADVLYDQPKSRAADPKTPYYLEEVYVHYNKKKIYKKSPFRHRILLIIKKLLYLIFLKKDYSLRFAIVSQKFIHNNFEELEIYFTKGCDNNYTIECEKRDRINEALVQVLEKHKNDKIFLIAHSMGSIIAFDVLSFIMPKATVNTFVTIGSPLGAPFVISRIARLYKSKHQGHIKLQTPEAVNKHWYNFSDIRDNIAADHKLSDDFEPNSKGVKVKDGIVVNTYKMNGKPNPHKSFGYLRTPEFIDVLTEFINEK